ncbi:MAG: 3-dehydroquinate synthase [Firmicutes bacterium]|nr:3-dehydroquinate synthase [Bacillota bacterium]
MEKVFVQTPGGSYPILIEKGFDSLAEAVERAVDKKSTAIVISDSNVAPIYGAVVISQLEKVFEKVSVFSFEAGEKSKHLDTIRDIYTFMLENKADRSTVVFGLGGGVCGDMAGFAAATFMRGVGFIQIPTTLLSQVDSSVGGKVGVDLNGVKNIVGAFYQPKLVYINTDTLITLPDREFGAGMAEVIKYGPIFSPDVYSFVENNKEKIKNGELLAIVKIIKDCCSVKAAVVNEDEKESGLREILNFGHTIGHAVETLKGFLLIHGECVAIGMAAAMKISADKGYIDEKEVERLEDILRYFDLPVRVSGLMEDDIYKTLFLDKKARNSKIGFVLIENIGTPLRTKELTEEEIRNGIRYILSEE